MIVVSTFGFVVSMPCSAESLNFLTQQVSSRTMTSIGVKSLIFTRLMQQVSSWHLWNGPSST